MKVLLQEQDDAMRAIIRPMLAGHESTLMEAKDPWEAAALVTRHVPDVVLLSATDVYEQARGVPAVLSSDSLPTAVLLLGAAEPHSAQVPRLPVDGYLPYPFDAKRLNQAIQSAIAARKAAVSPTGKSCADCGPAIPAQFAASLAGWSTAVSWR